MSDAIEKITSIRALVRRGQFASARQELAAAAEFAAQEPDSVIAAEFHYLTAVVDFDSKPHAEVLQLANRAYQIVNNTAENLLIGRIQALIGKLHVALGDLKAGEEYLRDAISSFRRISSESELVGCYNKLAQVYFVRGDFKQAEKFLSESIRFMELDSGSPNLPQIKAKGNLARIKILLGEWNQAEPMLEECIEFCRSNKVPASEARNILSLGYVCYLKEDHSRARELYQRALDLTKSEDLVRERSIYHEYVGDLYAALGDRNRARQHYGYALEIGYRIAPRSAIISQTERRLAELEFECCNYALASDHAGRALEVAEAVGEKVEIAAAQKILAALACNENHYREAMELFDSALTSLEEAGEKREEALVCLLAGKSLLPCVKERNLAGRYLRRAIKLSRKLGMSRQKLHSYYYLSQLEFDRGSYDSALKTLTTCEREGRISNDDLLLEECRILRLNIEEKLVAAGQSSENQFTLFSSFLTDKEYDHLKSGGLAENLDILRNRVGADRAFVLALDKQKHGYETLAAIEFDRTALSRISKSLANGRGGSIPLTEPLFVTSVDSDRGRIFDYISAGAIQISSLISVPIRLADDSSGIIYLDKVGHESGPFSKDDLFFALAYSDIIAFKSTEEQKLRLTRDNEMLKSQLQERLAFPNIITANEELLGILERVSQVKDSSISILIEGDTGTGKDLLAKAVHYNSNRKDKRFISVNCAALPETLLESELFGYRKGAFTGADSEKSGLFEEADEGTFYLDEIGDMPLAIQAKLLRIIEEKEVVRLGETTPRRVDVRVISATNCDLKESMEGGRFRQDLYYRLSTFAFRLPALRERREDVPLLIKHFISTIDPDVKLEPEAFSCLADYNWPGNVRELENEIKKLTLLVGDNKTVTKSLLSRRIVENWDGGSDLADTESAEFSLYDHLARIEREFIIKALRKNDWVKKYAAGFLSIPESTLRLKIKQYKIAKS